MYLILTTNERKALNLIKEIKMKEMVYYERISNLHRYEFWTKVELEIPRHLIDKDLLVLEFYDEDFKHWINVYHNFRVYKYQVLLSLNAEDDLSYHNKNTRIENINIFLKKKYLRGFIHLREIKGSKLYTDILQILYDYNYSNTDLIKKRPINFYALFKSSAHFKENKDLDLKSYLELLSIIKK